ncbi:MAG: DUF3015 family protein [bacterium]
MKKIAFMVIISFIAVVGMAHAGPKTDSNCGCGLGSMFFESQSDGLMTQICAATTNGSFGNQTFGITSGTLGCEKFSSFAMRERLNKFAADNMDNIASDIAAGEGEFLEAIADLAEVPQENRANLYVMLQNNFDAIFSSTEVTNEEVVQKITDIITQI